MILVQSETGTDSATKYYERFEICDVNLESVLEAFTISLQHRNKIHYSVYLACY